MTEDAQKTAGRAGVAAAALAALDDVGLDRLTIRRVAERLNVRPSALYWHFAGKEELLDYLADVILGDQLDGLGSPAPGVAWASWLAELAHRTRRALLSHRDGPRLFAGASPTRGALLQVIENTLGVLHSAGFSLSDAVYGANTLMNFTVGSALEEQAIHFRGASGKAGSQCGPPFVPDPGTHPNLARAAEISGQFDAEFEHGIALIVAGMRLRRAGQG